MKLVLMRRGDEVGIVQNLQVERNRRLDPLDDGHLERALHPRDRFGAVAAVRDDLRDERIVVRRDRALGVRIRVHAHARAARHAERVNEPWARRERLGILGVDPAFDRVAGDRDVALLERQPSPAAIRICSLTMSTPVTNSVTGCSTCRRVLTSRK